jgi:hypothetical protein
MDNDRFEQQWKEINWRWSRVLAFHVPGPEDADSTYSSASSGGCSLM